MRGESSFRGVVAALMGLALAPGLGIAQQPVMHGYTEPTIRVTGTGEARVEPDRAQLMFAVETFAETAREAGAENARRMDRVISALVEAGVPRDDIETRNYSLHPEYVHDEARREPRLRGYRASNQVVLRTGELGRLGAFIDVALGAGANRMDGISFSVSDPEPARREALREAVASARGSAEAIASALGVRLGPVIDASTSPVPYHPIPMMMRGRDMVETAAAAPPPTPIEPGEQTVHAQVSIIFSIEGGA